MPLLSSMTGRNITSVRGVVESDSGYFSKASDEEAATVYVSYGVVEKNAGEEMSDNSLPIDSYEILIKNPVQKFGYNALKNAIGLDEKQYEIVENSTRFGLANRLDILKNFGVRSMSTKKDHISLLGEPCKRIRGSDSITAGI